MRVLHVERLRHSATTGDRKCYFVDLMQFPTARSWLWAKLYHVYDMKIPSRLPGWRRFEKWLSRHGAEIRFGITDEKARIRDRLYSWTYNQDMRCYDNFNKALTIRSIEIDEKTFYALSPNPEKEKRF